MRIDTATVDKNPNCYVCGKRIQPGEGRKAETTDRTQLRRVKHWSSTRPDHLPRETFSELETEDVFRVRFVDLDAGGRGEEEWQYASVEGVGMCDREFVVSAILRNELARVRGTERPESPLGSDMFELVAEVREDGQGWREAVAYELEPDVDGMEVADDNEFRCIPHYLGTFQTKIESDNDEAV